MSRHRGLPAGSRVFGQPPAGPPVCQRNRLVRRHRPGAGRAHERRMAATGRDSAASRSNPPLAGTTVFSHDPPGVSVRTWSVAVRVRVSRGYAGGSPDGHLDHFRVTVRNGVDTRGRQGLMRVRSTLSQVTTCGRSRRHGLLALSLVLGILFVNSLHAQRAGDLRGLSDALESLTERVQPAVVQIFATGYTAGQGVVPSGGALLSRQQASGSGVILDPVATSSQTPTSSPMLRASKSSCRCRTMTQPDPDRFCNLAAKSLRHKSSVLITKPTWPC